MLLHLIYFFQEKSRTNAPSRDVAIVRHSRGICMSTSCPTPVGTFATKFFPVLIFFITQFAISIVVDLQEKFPKRRSANAARLSTSH